MTTYETAKNLAAEKALAKVYRETVYPEKQGLKMPKYHTTDWVIMDHAKPQPKVFELLECKRRYCTMDRYPTYQISAEKIIRMTFASTLGLRVVLAVQWDDCRAHRLISHEEYTYAWGGRKDRGGHSDMEVMVEFLPIEFHVFGGPPKEEQ